MSKTLIQLALLIAIFVTIFTHFFKLTMLIGICWIGWKFFENSDTYKTYSK